MPSDIHLLRTAPSYPPDKLSGLSPCSHAFRATIQAIERFAPHDRYPVLLEGEVGTGKTFLARRVHDRSPRSGRPFVERSLAAMDAEFANSDLFGHEEGSFTGAKKKRAGAFESARGGSLFLDEIDKASREVQGKLLQVIESKTMNPVGSDRSVRVDVRIIAGSSRPLAKLVDEGLFLPDLYSRLKCFAIPVLPLSERREDIPALVLELVARHAPYFKYERPPRVTGPLLAALQQEDWPYNVRDLEQAVIQILAHAGGAPLLELNHWSAPSAMQLLILKRPKRGHRRDDILHAARETGTIGGAAGRLGINRKTVRRVLNGLAPAERKALVDSAARGGRPTTGRSGRSADEEIERKRILEILVACKFDIGLTARAIGKDLSTVYRLLTRLSISPGELRKSAKGTAAQRSRT